MITTMTMIEGCITLNKLNLHGGGRTFFLTLGGRPTVALIGPTRFAARRRRSACPFLDMICGARVLWEWSTQSRAERRKPGGSPENSKSAAASQAHLGTPSYLWFVGRSRSGAEVVGRGLSGACQQPGLCLPGTRTQVSTRRSSL
jgi:hypothetical protein